MDLQARVLQTGWLFYLEEIYRSMVRLVGMSPTAVDKWDRSGCHGPPGDSIGNTSCLTWVVDNCRPEPLMDFYELLVLGLYSPPLIGTI